MNFIKLKPSGNWRPTFLVIALPACLFAAGCGDRHTPASDTTTVTGKDPSRSSAGILLPAERLTFYSVPLRCSAAPEIGCGSRAKPVLREPERAAGINEAWLSRDGTQLAVVWAEGGSANARMNTLEAVLRGQELTATELAGEARAQALMGFQSGAGWYGADDVDRLSEEEAGIIAARFVRRVQAKTPLPEAQAERLRTALTDTLKARFLGSPEKLPRTEDEEREAFFEAAATYLNETELTALGEAIASGFGRWRVMNER